MQRDKSVLTRTLLAAVSLASLAGATAAWAASGGASSRNVAPTPDGMTMKGSAHGSSTSSNLVDHGGPVLASSKTYAIFWGSQSAWASDVQSGLASFFGGLNGSSFLNTGTQYMRGAGIGSTFASPAKVDTTAPPRKVSPSTLGTEVAKVFGTNVDPNGVYFVYTSNFPSGGNFCAWHSYATVNHTPIAVAYMPNTTNVAGCNPGTMSGVTGSEGLRSLANVTSHEFMEAITDDLPAQSTYGWIDNSGSEIGDKCAWQFSSPVTLGGTKWELQEEWSNAAGGCVQTTP